MRPGASISTPVFTPPLPMRLTPLKWTLLHWVTLPHLHTIDTGHGNPHSAQALGHWNVAKGRVLDRCRAQLTPHYHAAAHSRRDIIQEWEGKHLLELHSTRRVRWQSLCLWLTPKLSRSVADSCSAPFFSFLNNCTDWYLLFGFFYVCFVLKFLLFRFLWLHEY